jgi:hypothetical protein
MDDLGQIKIPVQCLNKKSRILVRFNSSFGGKTTGVKIAGLA